MNTRNMFCGEIRKRSVYFVEKDFLSGAIFVCFIIIIYIIW